MIGKFGEFSRSTRKPILRQRRRTIGHFGEMSRSVPIIIDGWNFIRAPESRISDDDTDSLEAAERLISHLEGFQETHGDPIILVFDSAREHLGIACKNNALLTVVASKDADKYIKRYIDKVPERQRRNMRVVSSDNEVYYYAKSSYATPLRCGEFWAKLRR